MLAVKVFESLSLVTSWLVWSLSRVASLCDTVAYGALVAVMVPGSLLEVSRRPRTVVVLAACYCPLA